jgi:BspA type Leucine rich repeat region (6 copies)
MNLLPIEIRFHILSFVEADLISLSLTSTYFNHLVQNYLNFKIRFFLRKLNRDEKLQKLDYKLLQRFREQKDYDNFVLEVFKDEFFHFPIEFSLKEEYVEEKMLTPLEMGLLRFHFKGQMVYNCSKIEKIEEYLDRNLTVVVDQDIVGDLNIFTSIKKVVKDLPYKNVVILSGISTGIEFLVDCTSITTLILPPEMTSIGFDFLYNCISLTSLTLSTKLISIGFNFLNNCTSLINLTLPTRITFIRRYFLNNCTSLTSLILPPKMTSIGSHFLNNCTSLTTLNLPSNLTFVGFNFLHDCTSLTTLIIPSGITSIGHNFLLNCISLTSLIILAEINSIGNCFLYDCRSLTSLTLPAGINYIGYNFLHGCTSLEVINLPTGPISIEKYKRRFHP